MKVNLTKADLLAIDRVLDMAIENSCSCGEVPGDLDGYLGHARDCHVHRYAKYLKRVDAILNRAKESTHAQP